MEGRTRRISLLFSEKADRRLLEEFLSQEGFKVYAPDISSGININRLGRADMLIVDEQGGSKHVQALLSLKQSGVFLPLLMALPEGRKADPWLKAGFDDILRMPLTKAELLNRIHVFLRLREQSEEQYRSFVENSVIGFYRAAPDGRLFMVNPSLVKMLGFSSFEELEKWNSEKKWMAGRFSRPAFREKIAQNGQIAGLETAWLKPDGTDIYVRENVRVIRDAKNKILYYEGTVEDITERRRQEQRLQEAEKKFRDLTEKSLVGVYLIQDYVFKYVNPRLAEIFGYTVDELIGKMGPKELTFPEDWPIVEENFRRRLEGEAASINYEFRGMRKDKSLIFVEVYGSRTDYMGKPAVIGTLMDITERKRMEEYLRESEERYRTVFEGAAEGILVGDVATKELRYANPAICQMLGYTQDELTQMTVFDIHPKDSVEHVIEEFEAQARGEKILAPNIPCLRKDGTIFYADIRTTSIIIGEKKYNVGFFSNVTERKEREERLESSHRQMRDFTAYLQAAREDERTAIAREIHDELGQRLTALKMDLAWLGQHLPEKQKALMEKKDSMKSSVDSLLQTIKGISSRLRPGFLDELGLVGALELYAEEFHERSGIPCDVKIEEKTIK
ncbi:MAG: PAS domain S-box protein, partial [Candidatus Aminicenantales bacterium]